MSDKTPLLDQMRPCSVLVDSADVVKYFCGNGKYRYYAQLDVLRVCKNYTPPLDPPQETNLEELENLESLPILDLQNPISLHELLHKNDVLSVCAPSQNSETNKISSPVKEPSDTIQTNCNESNMENCKNTVKSVTLKCNSNSISKTVKTNTKKQKLYIITEVIKNRKDKRTFSKFTCSKCNKSFTNVDFVKRHIRKVHGRTVHCTKCLAYYKSKIELNEHKCKKIIIKPKKCIYTCELCAKVIKSRKLLKIHAKEHVEFMQPISKTELDNVKFFKSVYKNQLKNINVHCISCCSDLHYVEFFTNHFTQCCQNSNFICPLCNITKYHFDSMTNHLKRHLVFVGKVFKCHHCDLLFLNDVNMTIHMEKKHQTEVKKKDIRVHMIQCNPKLESQEIVDSVVEEHSGVNEKLDDYVTDTIRESSEIVSVCNEKNNVDVKDNSQEIVIQVKKKKRKRRSTVPGRGRQKKRKIIQDTGVESVVKNEDKNLELIQCNSMPESQDIVDVVEEGSGAIETDSKPESSEIVSGFNENNDIKPHCQDAVQVKKRRKDKYTITVFGRRKKRKIIQHSKFELLNKNSEKTDVLKCCVIVNNTEEEKRLDIEGERLETGGERLETPGERLETQGDKLQTEEKKVEEIVPVENTEENQNTIIPESQKPDSGIDSDTSNSEKENQVLKLIETQQQQQEPEPSSKMLQISSKLEQITSNITIKLDCNTMCLPCEKTYTFDTYLSHLPTCLTTNNFSCSFCDIKLSKRYSDKQFKHLESHFTCSDNMESVCDMCDLVFANEHNMIVHVQNDHFM